MNHHQQSAPRVSLGLPLYNGGCFLPAALDSLLAQTYDDFELIISDNGSTDESQDICRRYAAGDRRIRYFREPDNRGAVWNFNRVFQLSRGELFKWAAHDDVCRPTFLQQCVEMLDQHPEAVLSFPRTALIDATGRLLKDASGTYAEEEGLEQARPSARLRELLVSRVWVHEIYGLIRAAALRRTRLLPRYVGAEKVLMAELTLQGTFRQVPEVLFHCRWHAQQASWIASASEEQRWRDPQSAHLVRIPRHLACAVGQLHALLHAELPLAERLCCAGAVVRWVFQIRKWKRLVTHFLRGLGSGGVVAAGQPLPCDAPPATPKRLSADSTLIPVVRQVPCPADGTHIPEDRQERFLAERSP